MRSEQRDAIEQVLAYDHGILCAPTAFGKTVVGAYLIAKRAVNALILVHRRQLMDQWRERLAAFLVWCLQRFFTFGDFVHDFVDRRCPHKDVWVLIVIVDVIKDGFD